MTTKYVNQDGADFYLHDSALAERVDEVVTAPVHVSDYDMAAATNARKWFTQVWCPKNNVLPKFDP